MHPLFQNLVQMCGGFGRDRNGGTLPMVAVGLVVSMGAGAIGVDLVKAHAMRQSLSLAADAAALAAAPRLPDGNAARQAALDYVERNLPAAEHGTVLAPSDVVFGNWDPQTKTFTPASNQGAGTSGNAVQVITRYEGANGNSMATSLANVIGISSLDVSVSAIAGRGRVPCVLTLESSGKDSMQIRSDGALETIQCGVQVNSNSGGALNVGNNAELISDDICVGGTANIKASATVPTSPREYCPGRPDPLANVPLPGFGACDHHDIEYWSVTQTISPGVYCGGVEISQKSNVTLSPGLYVIKDGPLLVEKGSIISGSGVTIVLTGNDTYLWFSQASTINLSAPTSGPTEGILLFQDRNFDMDHNWNGDSTTDLVGVIYLPTGTLHADSGNQITPHNSCTVLIVWDLLVTNKSSVSVDFSSSSCRNSLPAAYRRDVVLLQ